MDAEVKQATHRKEDFPQWYIFRPCYLQKNGTWNRTATPHGYYHTKEEAERVLEAPFTFEGDGAGI